MRSFLQDRPSQLAIGVFVATFAHAMLALREVRSGEEGSVPALAISVAFLLVVVSIVVLVLYIHHIGLSLRVSSLIELVGRDTRRLIERQYPSDDEAGAATADVLVAPRSGVVFRIDHDALVQRAATAGCTLVLRVGIGEFVPQGAPLVQVQGQAGA